MTGPPVVADCPLDEPLRIESIDQEGNGVAHRDGKVVFVRGAITGESARVRVVRRKPRFDVGEIIELRRESSQRVVPECPSFGVCGGCSLQHVAPPMQVAIKQRALEDQLWHIGKVRPETVLRAIAGPSWGYRHRARLSVRHVPKKGGVLVGFHERGRSYVADMRECRVLPPAVSDLLLPLRELVGTLSIRDRMPQVEVAVGSAARVDADPARAAPGRPGARALVVALVFRVLESPSSDDLELLRRFSESHALEVWLQPKGPDTISLYAASGVTAAAGAASALAYELPEFGIRMPYRPTDFTQVNHAINEVMVSRALRLLSPGPGERVADLFCGLGNFSLPLAACGADVLGIEGSDALVARAADNARVNRLHERARFEVADLFALTRADWDGRGYFDRVLIDPPREGALAIAQALAEDGVARPRRIVYVSCNPATLARDASVLVHRGGFALRAAGVMNMFPHTSHVESIAVFEPT